MADKKTMWTPSDKQEAPKKKAKKAIKKAAKSSEPTVNKDGNIAGARVSFSEIQKGMKNQAHPVITTSKKRRKKI